MSADKAAWLGQTADDFMRTHHLPFLAGAEVCDDQVISVYAQAFPEPMGPVWNPVEIRFSVKFASGETAETTRPVLPAFWIR